MKTLLLGHILRPDHSVPSQVPLQDNDTVHPTLDRQKICNGAAWLWQIIITIIVVNIDNSQLFNIITSGQYDQNLMNSDIY